ESGLPLFVNIPWVGHVFGSTGRSDNRQELMIFLQPEIIDNSIHESNFQADMKSRAALWDAAEEFSKPRIHAEVEPAGQFKPARGLRGIIQALKPKRP
ncbi:MAG: hypothetical protein AAF585_24300, partial [Verrucomicrobiota bacterium]